MSTKLASVKSADESDKVQCQVCKKHSAHVLLPHLQEAHKMTALEYSEAHPGAPVLSHLGIEMVKKPMHDARQHAIAPREFEEITVGEMMGGVGEWKNEKAFKVRRYIGEADWVPPGDDRGYYYDYNATMTLVYGLHRERRNSIWIKGYPGTGKSTLVTNICRRLNREMIRINLDSMVTRADLIGDWTVRGGETVFKYGLLPQAMIRGAVLVLDEYDLCNPYLAAIFRPVLEENSRLVILENGGEVVIPDSNFRVVATANTFGNGDDTGLHATAHSLSLADRQRFSLFIELEYLEPDVEKKLLMDAVKDLDPEEAAMMVQVATKIREQFKERKVEESVSPRQLVNWAEIFSESGDAQVAANLSFLLPLSQASQLAIRQLITESGLPTRR